MAAAVESGLVAAVAYGDVFVAVEVDCLAVAARGVGSIDVGGRCDAVITVARAVVGGAVVELPVA